MPKFDSIDEAFAAIKIDSARHHLLLCLGPDCAPLGEGHATWDFLKRRCAELNLPILRTKAGCLRLCVGGPWLVVYPEGIWYGSVTPERCGRILQEHIRDGKPVREWIARTQPLCAQKEP